MNALLFQVDGKLPNVALMRIASHHRALGHDIELRVSARPSLGMFDAPDFVYASAIFTRSMSALEDLRAEFPSAVIGGTGWSVASSLPAVGIHARELDYSIYPRFQHSIGFTQRGCRLKCKFCVVPEKEGAVAEDLSPWEIWRGDPYPKNLILLDNDFFGQPRWKERIAEIRDGGFKVSFCQGINARFLTDETAEAVASIEYRDDQFQTKRIYTAWDNAKDESRLFAGLDLLVKHGVKPDHIMVYTLIGFWPQETDADWDYRRARLRDFGARPYPMPFVRNALSVGFQRFVIGAYDKRFTWAQWKEAKCRPENLTPELGVQDLALCTEECEAEGAR